MSATSQVHRIKRQIYEIVVPDAGLASLCHTRLTALQSASIAPLIDRHCGELADGETLLRLDRVEVDLGTIPLAAFEPGVLERLHDRLKPALAAAIEARQSRVGGARQSRVDSQLELLAAFARTGALPWWVDAGTAQPVAGALRRLATDAPDALRQLVRELATVPGAVDGTCVLVPYEVVATGVPVESRTVRLQP